MNNQNHHYKNDQLYRLIYSSSMKVLTTKESYVEILRKSRHNNQRDEISGILAFGDGAFLQILEGNRRKVWATFSRICTDDRHRDVQLIDFAGASQRLFGAWSMQGIAVRQEILRMLDFEDHFAPRHWSAETCLSFATRYSLLSKLNALAGQQSQNASNSAVAGSSGSGNVAAMVRATMSPAGT